MSCAPGCRTCGPARRTCAARSRRSTPRPPTRTPTSSSPTTLTASSPSCAAAPPPPASASGSGCCGCWSRTSSSDRRRSPSATASRSGNGPPAAAATKTAPTRRVTCARVIHCIWGRDFPGLGKSCGHNSGLMPARVKHSHPVSYPPVVADLTLFEEFQDRQDPPVGGVALGQVQFGEDAADVFFHRSFGDEDPLGDAGVGGALGHQGEYLAFPW